MLEGLHKVSLSKWKKATLFRVDFFWAFPLKPPCVLAIEDWSVCTGKRTSAASLPNQIEFWCRLCVFLRSKKCSVPSLCNWRLGRGVEAQRQGIRERWVCPVRFPLSYLTSAILLGYITQLSLSMFHKERSTSSIVPSPPPELCKASSALKMHLCHRQHDVHIYPQRAAVALRAAVRSGIV